MVSKYLTVKDVIEKLKEFPEDMEVLIEGYAYEVGKKKRLVSISRMNWPFYNDDEIKVPLIKCQDCIIIYGEDE